MTFHVDGSLPTTDGTVFVFGSNLAGIHAGGAARVAQEKFGAEQGRVRGAWAFSYAIPTLDAQFAKLPLAHIENNVTAFLADSTNDPDTEFFVTRIGCGIAGFADQDIAPMFKGAPPNCSFANEWEKFL